MLWWHIELNEEVRVRAQIADILHSRQLAKLLNFVGCIGGLSSGPSVMTCLRKVGGHKCKKAAGDGKDKMGSQLR